MKLQIATVGKAVIVGIDTSDITDRGEVAHYIVELERLKNKLQRIWEEMD